MTSGQGDDAAASTGGPNESAGGSSVDAGNSAAGTDGSSGGADGSSGGADGVGGAGGGTDGGSAGAGSWGGGTVLGDNSVARSLVATVQAGDGDFRFGSDRAITNPPNWHSQRSTELYNSAVNNNDPSSAQASSQDWIAQAAELKEVSDQLYQAITELSAAWVGNGAGAAQGALAEIASSGAKAGSAAKVMGQRMEQQSQAAAEVKKMPPPKEFDNEQALKAILAGGPAAMAADMKEQHDEAEEVKAEQVRYFNSYTNAMSEVDSSTPSFGPESIGLGAPGDSRASAPSAFAGGNVVPQAMPGSATEPTAMRVDTAGGGGASGLGAGSAAPGGAGQQVVGSNPVPGGSTVSADPTPPSPGQAVPAAAGGGGHAALGGAALAGGLAAVGGGLAAGKQTGAVRKDGDDLVGQEEPDEAEDDIELDEGAESSSSATEVASSESVAAPMAQSGVGSGMSAQAGAGGSAPMGAPMAGGAAGAGAGSDQEHTHSSFLIEPDPDDVFGAGQSVAPPVIGEWSDDEF